ncbi:MAG: glycosyl hydrolase family 18 protein [Bacillota bacterium]
MKKKIAVSMIIIMGLMMGILIGVLEFKKDKASASVEGETAIVIGDMKLADPHYAVIEEEGVYIPYETVKQQLDSNMILDETGKRVFIQLEDKPFYLENEELTRYIKENRVTINIPTKIIEGKPYLPLDVMGKIMGIQGAYYHETNRIVIDKMGEKMMIGEIVKNRVKLQPEENMDDDYDVALKLGDKMNVLGEIDGKYKVRTSEGVIGFVAKKDAKIIEERLIQSQPINQGREAWKIGDDKISLAWEYVYEKSPDLSEELALEGLDVIVPTWFHIDDEDGNIINNGDPQYVQQAHDKGYKVWGLVDNSFNPALTSKILSDETLKRKVIGQLVLYADLYNLDGINIDFENVNYADKDKLVQFVKELREKTKKQNLILSMDVTVPSSSENWSKVYDRKALSQHVDYMAVMTYDEHWGSSPVSGSVASISWVEKGIQRSMESIPKEKILLGIPFYTRIWEEYLDKDGKRKVKSQAVSMTKAWELVSEKGTEAIWNEDAGQFYAEYVEEGSTFKVWLEDSKSVALKADMVDQYDLAGTAAWRRKFEDPKVWAVLQQMIKEGKKYEDMLFE